MFIIYLILLLAQKSISASSPETQESAPAQWDRQSQLEEGVTTAENDQRGNWYFKRQIFREAGALYKALGEKAARVQEAYKNFFTQRASLDATINSFLHDSRISMELIEKKIIELHEKIMDLEKRSDLTEQDQNLLKQSRILKEKIEDLKSNILLIQELDSSFDKALSIVSEQGELSNSFVQKAWSNYESISEILNDSHAEKLLLEMQGFNTNLDAILVYVSKDFPTYIAAVITTTNDHIETIKKEVESLEQDGIILKGAVEKPEKTPESGGQTTSVEKKPVEHTESWWSKILYYLFAPFRELYTWIRSFFKK